MNKIQETKNQLRIGLLIAKQVLKLIDAVNTLKDNQNSITKLLFTMKVKERTYKYFFTGKRV